MGILRSAIGKLLPPRSRKASGPGGHAEALQRAIDLMAEGRRHEAIVDLRKVLEDDPTNVHVLNDLGACLSDTGAEAEARGLFELAYSLDDSFTPVAVNHAHMLVNQWRAEEALRLLRRAKAIAPNYGHTDAVYANLQLKLGHVDRARHFQKRAWLSHFDNLRLANGHLFDGSYDIDEAEVAAEHRFWAHTCRPVEPPDGDPPSPERDAGMGQRRLRIGYWSPDFRDHAVRFFFRPLLEGHDRKRVEVHLYHDIPQRDHQTELIQAAAEHFHDVCHLSDRALCELVRSHRLDVLIELAGHSSNNRIHLLQQRLAPLQLSGLGYPPTTGLSSLDGKFTDVHIAAGQATECATEAPFVLPRSFWCFDPCDAVPPPAAPAFERAGHITFGCSGNIAKITDVLLRCWRDILQRVPQSRLKVRSINLQDPASVAALSRRIEAAGLPADRCELLGPASGVDFFRSYDELDIVLDTYPYNGGTTTCFAAYMGVPVVTWAGRSLTSRMGLSVMSNLGAAHLVAEDALGYVEKASALAFDPGFLRSFRREARGKLLASSLGDGRAFARDVEDTCLAWLERPVERHPTTVPNLPADELVRRAIAVSRYGQTQARRRILDHCLATYPDHGTAHLLRAEDLAGEQGREAAVAYLRDRLPTFDGDQQAAAWINITRLHLRDEDIEAAGAALDMLATTAPKDPADRVQARLYAALVRLRRGGPVPRPTADRIGAKRVRVLTPCDDPALHERVIEHWKRLVETPPGWTVRHQRCDDARRIPAYVQALASDDDDILVLLQRNAEIQSPRFLRDVAEALEAADLVGYHGARRWTRLDWRVDDFVQRSGCAMVRTLPKAPEIELRWSGCDTAVQVDGMAVLAGDLIACRPSALRKIAFDEDMARAEYMLEETWTQAAARAGLRLRVHRGLGVVLDASVNIDVTYLGDARIQHADRNGIEPFDMAREDSLTLGLPPLAPHEALQALDILFADLDGFAT